MAAPFLLVLVLALAAAPPSPTPAETGPSIVLDRIAAVVGDDVLLDSEVDRYVAAGVVERREGETDAAYRERVLNERIVDLLRERELRKTAGFDPDPREVDERMAAIASRVAKERGRPFDEVLAGAGVTRAEVAVWVKRGLALTAFVRERLLPTVKLSDAEVAAFYEGPFRVEMQTLGLAALPPLAEVDDQVRVLLRERKLNAEIERWTNELREKTRVLVYRRTAASGSESR